MSPRQAPPDAFGRTAREYELGRPMCPEKLLDRVVAETRLERDATVLDLGAGTGKLTRALVLRDDVYFSSGRVAARDGASSSRKERFSSALHWTRRV